MPRIVLTEKRPCFLCFFKKYELILTALLMGICQNDRWAQEEYLSNDSRTKESFQQPDVFL
jgi:hypothetical protein